MDRTADLDAALSFVIGRIGEQAVLSGEPLSDEQNLLLKYLPSSMPESWDPETTLVPRNVNYEQLCALGKVAYLNDRKVNPTSLDWEFAFAVFELNRHPMWGLLQCAGVKRRRPWWDTFILTIIALVFIAATMALMLPAANAPWTPSQWVGIASGYVAVLLLMYFASRRIDERQLEKDIERCRRASRF